MRGTLPVLTIEQRADLAKIVLEKRRLRAEMRRLHDEINAIKRQQNRVLAQLQALPSNRKLSKRYGVCEVTIQNSTKGYKKLNPLDNPHHQAGA